jgi:hypothetical protein
MKLVDSIKAVETGNRQLITEPLYSIKLETDKLPTHCDVKFVKEYSITVTLGAHQWIAEDLIRSSDGEVIDYTIQRMKYMIVEEVYGELRRDLIDLQMEMRNELNYYDSPSLKKLVQIVEKISL